MVKEKAPVYSWHFHNEVYQSLMGSYDVDLAKHILQDKPRQPVQANIKELASWVKRPWTDKEGVTHMIIGHCVKWSELDADPFKFDLSFPIIAVRMKGNIWPIDGWHRIAKAIDQGLEALPALLLNVQESKKVKLP